MESDGIWKAQKSTNPDCGPSNLEIALVTRLTTFKTVDLPMPKAFVSIFMW